MNLMMEKAQTLDKPLKKKKNSYYYKNKLTRLFI